MTHRAVLAALLVALSSAAWAQDESAPPPPPPSQLTEPPPIAAPPLLAWVARGGAALTLLNKVSAQSTQLSARIGETLRAGTLTIVVRACDVRPPDQAADATVWLDITDSDPGMPQFHGWMLLSAPAVSSFEHPIYDVRLIGCQ